MANGKEPRRIHLAGHFGHGCACSVVLTFGIPAPRRYLVFVLGKLLFPVAAGSRTSLQSKFVRTKVLPDSRVVVVLSYA